MLPFFDHFLSSIMHTNKLYLRINAFIFRINLGYSARPFSVTTVP